MRYFTLPVLAFLIISLASCQNTPDEDTVKYQTLKPTSALSAINDSLFVTDGVLEMVATDDIFFLSDMTSGHSLILDQDFSLISSIPHGLGPGEIMESFNAQIIEDRLYVFDSQKQAIHKYDLKGAHINTLRPPAELGMSFIDKISINSLEEVFGNSLDTDSSIVYIDKDMKLAKRYGTMVPYENYGHKRALNTKYILAKDNEEILSIWSSSPVIDRYSKDGRLLETLEMKDFFQFRIDRMEEMLSSNPSLKYKLIFAFYNDLYIDNDKLYILFIGDNKYHLSNDVMVIDLSGKSMRVERIINLDVPGAFFKQIAVAGDKLWAFDKGGAEILEFSIKN